MGKTWIRLYTHVPDDPKVQRLPDGVFKFWVNCMCLAGRKKGEGFLPPVEDIAFHLRVNVELVTEMRSLLIKAGLIVEVDGEYRMHDWDSWQYEDRSKERVNRHREKMKRPCNGDVTVVKRSSNDPVTPTIPDLSSVSVSVLSLNTIKQNTKTTTRETPQSSAAGFEEFYVRWSQVTKRRTNKSDACQAWLSVVHQAQVPYVMECLERYARSADVARGAVTLPHKWLYEQSRDEWTAEWPEVVERANAASSNLRKYLNEH